jgi:hypothetical protein
MFTFRLLPGRAYLRVGADQLADQLGKLPVGPFAAAG